MTAAGMVNDDNAAGLKILLNIVGCNKLLHTDSTRHHSRAVPRRGRNRLAAATICQSPNTNHVVRRRVREMISVFYLIMHIKLATHQWQGAE